MKNGQQGFTLLETLIATTILASGILLLSNSWSGNLMRLRKMQMAEQVSSLMQQKMTEIELQYREKISELPEEDGGDFGDDLPNYSWTLETKDIEIPDLSSSLSARKGGVDEMTMMVIKALTDHINKAVKEIKLTVIADLNGRQLKFPVSTYFVDYDKELSLGVPGSSQSSDSKASQ